MPPTPFPVEHQPAPLPGSVYSIVGLESDGSRPHDYPILGMCACSAPLVRMTPGEEWRHREPGAPLPDTPAGR